MSSAFTLGDHFLVEDKMRIGILSNQINAYPTERLLEECEKLEVEGLFIKTSLVRLFIHNDSSFNAHYLGRSLKDLNVVIPRIGSSMTAIGELILRHFEAMNIPLTSNSSSIHVARDKFHSFQRLAEEKLPVPETLLVNSFIQPMDFLNVRNLPVVLKPRNLFHGLGCVKVNELSLLKEIVEAIMSYSTQARRSIMIQEFISAEEKIPHQDYRLFVVDNRVIAAMTRKAAPSEWKTNVARGASTESYSPTKEEGELAVKATKILGLKIAGVDILHKDNKPIILEVNPCPGWKGIEEATGKNVAYEIIQYALRMIEKK